MKKLSQTILFLLVLLISSIVYAEPDFVSGYNNIKWGTSVANQKSFSKIPNRTPFQDKSVTVYRSSGENAVFLNRNKVMRPEEINYVALDGKLEVVFIIMSSSKPKMVQDFYFMKNALQDYYGNPAEVSGTGQEVFYRHAGASIKLSMGKNTKIILYSPAYFKRMQ
jgi:hypothetical protein